MNQSLRALRRIHVRSLAVALLLSWGCKDKATEADGPQTVTLPGPEGAAGKAEPPGATAAGATAAPEAVGRVPAETLLDRAVEAMGGKAKLDAVQTFYQEVTTEMPAQNLRGTTRLWWQRGNYYLETEFPGVGRIRAGRNGDVAWSEDPISGLRRLSGEEDEQSKWKSSLSVAADWRRYFDEAETVGSRTEDGRTLYEVELRKDGATKMTLVIDGESGDLVEMRFAQASPMGKVPITIRLGDYREVDGLRLPFRQEAKTSLGTAVETITKLEIGAPVDPSKFAMPTAPAGVRPVIPAPAGSPGGAAAAGSPTAPPPAEGGAPTPSVPPR